MDEPPERVPIVTTGTPSFDDANSVSLSDRPPAAVPDVPPPSIEDLRRRFSPHVQQSKSELVPKWVLIAGIGAIGLLVVAILVVVIVG